MFYKTFLLPMIYDATPFAFARYGDGEVIIMRGEKVGKDAQAYTRDKWYWDKEGSGIMSDYLIETLTYPGGYYFYGFPQNPEFQQYKGYMMRKGSIPQYFIKDSLLFYYNFELIKVLITDAFNHSLERDVILVINQRHKPKESIIRSLVKDVFFVDDDLPNMFEEEKKRSNLLDDCKKLTTKHQNSLFIISAGPFSEIFIYQAWKHSRTNQYMDMGSAFDIVFDDFFKNLNGTVPNIL